MNKVLFFIVVFVLLVLTFFSGFKAIQTKKVNNKLQCSLDSIKKELHYYENSYCFNAIKSNISSEKYVLSGDSIEFEASIDAGNVIENKQDKPEVYVILANGISPDFQTLIDVYDTIYSNDLLFRFKIKTDGLGKDTIFGSINIPSRDHKYLDFNFTKVFYKVDQKSYNDLKKMEQLK